MQEMSLSVSSSPHLRADDNVRSTMLDVIIALMPALLYAVVYAWKWRALAIVLVTVISCVFFEWAYRKLLGKPGSIGDLSAVVTGVLLAFCLPVGVPYWLPVVGAFFAIVVVKQLYGGLGKNFMNPALAARAVLFVSWSAQMMTWHNTGQAVPLWGSVADATTGPTPLALLRQTPIKLPTDEYSLQQLLFGQHGGSLGEVSIVLLLVGGLYLLVRRVITARIPVAFIGTVALVTFVFPQGGADRLDFMLSHLLTGGLVLGAVFMATDYSTSPATRGGQWLFGIGCGLLTVFIRYFGSYPEGVSFAILIMNACVWMIDKAFMPRRFGTKFFGRKGKAV